MLVGEDAAIVTDIPGTTRDVLRHSLPLGRIMLNVADTAGIREREDMDAVERIGIEKSRKMIEKSELMLAIFDISRPFDLEDDMIVEAVNASFATKIAILNKTDLAHVLDESRLQGFDAIIRISAKEEAQAISTLTATVEKMFADEKIVVGADPIISSARQKAALTRSLDFINAATTSLQLGFSQDAVSTDVERALGAISELDGRAVSDEIVADIFSKFCVGK